MKRIVLRFYSYTRALLPTPDFNLMDTATVTLSKVLKAGGVHFDETFIDYQVQEAVSLLQSDKPERYAGVLVLKALAPHSPNYFYLHIPLVLEKLTYPLRDSRIVVRDAAAELLALCLDIMHQRDRQSKAPILHQILQEAHNGLKSTSVDVIHGSLIVYRELLRHSGMVCRSSLHVHNSLTNDLYSS